MNNNEQTTGVAAPTDHLISEITAIARIAKGKCTHCQADLTDVISAIKAGTISIPDECPQCHARFVKNRITELVTVFRCGGCESELPEGGPDQNIYCRHCGSLLDWSDVKRG